MSRPQTRSLFATGAQREWTLAGGAEAVLSPCEAGPLGAQAAALAAASRGDLSLALGDESRRARLFAPQVQRDRLAALTLEGRFAGYLAFAQDGRGALAPDRADFDRVYGAGAGWRAMVYRLSATQGPRDAISLDQLHVAPHARRRGAGRLLCAWLAEAARRAGYARLLVDVAADNTAARALYESQAFRLAEFELPLPRRVARALTGAGYRRYELNLASPQV